MEDLEICKRIAEIEGKEFDRHPDTNQFCVKPVINGLTYYSNYNPLTDDALCFQLMKKHEIDVRFRGHDAECGDDIFHISANYVVCLAIIAAHEEK